MRNDGYSAAGLLFFFDQPKFDDFIRSFPSSISLSFKLEAFNEKPHLVPLGQLVTHSQISVHSANEYFAKLFSAVEQAICEPRIQIMIKEQHYFSTKQGRVEYVRYLTTASLIAHMATKNRLIPSVALEIMNFLAPAFVRPIAERMSRRLARGETVAKIHFLNELRAVCQTKLSTYPWVSPILSILDRKGSTLDQTIEQVHQLVEDILRPPPPEKEKELMEMREIDLAKYIKKQCEVFLAAASKDEQTPSSQRPKG